MQDGFAFLPAAGLVPLPEARLLILVGLTGVGKSSFARALGWPLLPNRRELVDAYVLPQLGADPDELGREERFALTRRWRAAHPGGLAEALAAAYVRPRWPLVFDGLRGEAEVAYAHRHLPRASFVVLQAPLAVRLERLLGRRDAFDRVAAKAGEELLAAAQGTIGVSEIEELLRRGHDAAEVAAKLRILAAEQINYDQEGPRRALAGCRRALFVDTTSHGPEQAAALVREWLSDED